MKTSTKSLLVAVCLAGASLVGCGGSEPSDGATGNHDAAGHDVAPGPDAAVPHDDAGAAADVCVAPDFAMCGTVCIAISNDYYHCGACGTACQTGQTCMSGMCVGAGCPSPSQLNCAGTCTEVLSSDTHNCGGCGVTCPSGQSCHMGTCR